VYRYQYVSDTIPFTFNLYQYAYANPLRYTDADGLFNSPETLSKQRMMMHMTDEEREQFIDSDNQIMLGMSWDTGKDVVVGTVMMIPGTLRLIVEAGQKQIADATRFTQDALAWDITTAWHNRLQAEHDREQQLLHAIRTGFREYGQSLATNPRTVGQTIGGTLLLADGILKTGIRFAERRALRKLAAEQTASHGRLRRLASREPFPSLLTDERGFVRIGQSHSILEISDEAYVRFDPVMFDKSIQELGIQARFFRDGKIWLTKYGDVKNVINAKDLEMLLYRRNLWPLVKGKFEQGATLRVIRNIEDAVPAGVTNKTWGVRQWRITRDISPQDLILVRRIYY